MIKRLKFWFNSARGYSVPMSVMSWSVPFIFALVDGGNVLYGIIALVGIVFAHAGVNLFDDFIDFLIEKSAIKKGLKPSFNLQKGKCEYLLNKKTTLNKLFFVICICFATAFVAGIFLTLKTGVIVIIITIIAGILSVLYPFLSYIALGEVTVAIMFAPLLYTGVYYVMTGTYSVELLPIAISTGLLTVGLLHTHMFMDYDFDIENKKTTLCSIAGTKMNAVRIQLIIMFLAYTNIVVWVFFGLPKIFLLGLLSVPTGIVLYKLLILHITNPDLDIKPNLFFGIIESQEKYKQLGNINFMIKFMVARNVMVTFTFFICLAKIISEFT